MPSEHKLHPLSFLFSVGSHMRTILLPGLLVLVTARSGTWQTWSIAAWQVVAMVALLPYAVSSLIRYLTFRYRYAPEELVIRTGLIFRNERHIPYARIHNIDSLQNPLHRLFRVAEVRIETAGGAEPEARIQVLPEDAIEEMRRRVFEMNRGGAGATVPAHMADGLGAHPSVASREAAAHGRHSGTSGTVVASRVDAPASAKPPSQAVLDSQTEILAGSTVGSAPSRRTLLHLPLREVLLHGIVDNRGVVVMAAMLGLLWEAGLLGRIETWIVGEAELTQRSLLRGVWRTFLGLSSLKARDLTFTLGGILLLLVVIRIFSVCWAVLNLYGFTLTRTGDELSVHCGLFTRRLATIPQQRIQTLSVRETPLHRLFGRAAVRVETAGGNESADAAIQKQRVAPLVARGSLPELVKAILPELDLTGLEWQRAHPRAFRRALKRSLIVAGLIALGCVTFARWWTPVLFAALVPIAWLNARFWVAHLGYALTPDVVVFRSGWLWRKLTAARYAKVQAVTLGESPFDRRSRMASVRVDTAGAGNTSHRIDIPYLDRVEASRIFERLTAQAAVTAFRW